MQKGDKVRVRDDTSSFAIEEKGIAGHRGTIAKVFDEPDDQHDEEVLPMFLVLFDHPDEKSWEHWLSDFEFWSDELEVIDV